ncbi:hypothetical protein CsatB_016101 [Cannabis sativa]
MGIFFFVSLVISVLRGQHGSIWKILSILRWISRIKAIKFRRIVFATIVPVAAAAILMYFIRKFQPNVPLMTEVKIESIDTEIAESKIESLSSSMAVIEEKIDDLIEASKNPNHGDNNNVIYLQAQLGRELAEIMGPASDYSNKIIYLRGVTILATNHDLLMVFSTMPIDWKRSYIYHIGSDSVGHY